jgi:hypothetical protein
MGSPQAIEFFPFLREQCTVQSKDTTDRQSSWPCTGRMAKVKQKFVAIPLNRSCVRYIFIPLHRVSTVLSHIIVVFCQIYVL